MASEVFTTPPKAGVKLSKEDAGYVAKGPFGCLNCEWYEGKKSSTSTGNCAVVGETVSGGGCCDYWNDQSAPKDAGKKRTEYVHVTGSHYRCDECKFFDKGSETCTPVRGHIDPGASCNKWMPGGKLVETYSLHLDPSLNTSLLEKIRSATEQGIKEATDSSVAKFTAPGGRLPKTDPDTLSTINAPCATCGHGFNHHIVEGTAGKCTFCFMKGSQHKYHETAEIPHHTVAGTSVAGITGNTRESVTYSTDNLFTEEELALIRLQESIWPSYDEEYQKPSGEDLKKARANRSKANLYNSHQLAAGRASAQAYQSGNESDHEVAAQHHDMAASAAANAQSSHKPGSRSHKDYRTAQTYHKSQAKAHRDAAKSSAAGNDIRHPVTTPSYY